MNKMSKDEKKDLAKLAAGSLGVVGTVFSGWLGFVGCMWVLGASVSLGFIALLIWVVVTVLRALNVIPV